MSGNALPEDYENERLEAARKKEIKCVCVCGEERVLNVPVDNEDTAHVTQYPCKCGRFMCVVGAEPGLHTPIDLMFET